MLQVARPDYRTMQEEGASFGAGEPRASELLPEVGAQARLERPRPEVAGRVEARVDVRQPLPRTPLPLRRKPLRLCERGTTNRRPASICF